MRSPCKLYFLPLLTLFVATTPAQTAKSGSTYTPVYSRNAGDCKDVDVSTVSEGEDVPQRCKGFGGYWLYRTSAVYRVSLAIEDASRKFMASVVAAENEEAKALEGRSVKKFGDKIEWLTVNGNLVAFILRVSYYKDTGDEQTVFTAKNRVGEFLFVRGVKGYEPLRYEISATNTAFNPNEQARLLATRFYEEHRK